MTGEARLVRGGVAAAGIAIPVAVVLALALRGVPGAVAAAAACGIVLVNFAISAVVLVVAARRFPLMFPMVAMPSFVARMLGVLAAMRALQNVETLDRAVFAVTFGIGVAALLIYECWLYAKTPWLALTFSPTKETS